MSSLQKNRFFPFIFIFLIYFFPPLLQPLPADGATLIYTVQAGSFKDIEKALKQYDSITDVLYKEELHYLRIEKIGQYFSVRLGSFKTHKQAERFYKAVRLRLPSVILMSAYIKDHRLQKLYSPVQPENKVQKKPGLLPGRKDKTSSLIDSDVKKKTEISSHHDEKGASYVKDKRFISAAEEYQRAIIKDPDNPVLYFKLARTLSKIGLTDEAINSMKKAVDLTSGGNAGFSGELGKLYLSRGMPEKAKEQFLAALKAQPDLGDIHYYMGIVFMREENYDMAWLAARTAGSLGYKPKDLMNILSLLSEEPRDMPWNDSRDEMYIRHIIVDTREKAEDMLNRISEGEFIESFIGIIDPSKVHKKIANALSKQKVFADPVIVETEYGFHIVQRFVLFHVYYQKDEMLSRAQKSDPQADTKQAKK